MIIPTAEPFFFQGGPTGCLLIHGFTGTPKEMRGLGVYLANQGHTVLGIRLNGHATQPKDMIRTRWRDWLTSVEDGYHLLSSVTKQIFIVGFSLGGNLATLFAAHKPVSGLILMATPHHLPNDPRLPFVKIISLLMPYLKKGQPGWHDMEAYKAHICYPVDPIRSYAEVNTLVKEMQVTLPKISIPTQLIFARQDQVLQASEQHAEKIYAALGSTDKQLVWIEESSHMLLCDHKRELAFQAIAEFIQRESKRSS